MNATARIEAVIGFVATVAIVIGLGVAIWREPERIDAAQADILAEQIDDAMTIYAENCAVCHGPGGEGIGSNPPLAIEAWRDADFETLQKVIERGRFDTAMPAWAKSEGGPLSDYQVTELVALIQLGDWQETAQRVTDLDLTPLVPFTAEPDPEILAELDAVDGGDLLQRALTVYAAECVACHGPDGLGTAIAPALNDDSVRATATEEITRVIQVGVSGTLMAGWESTLSSEDIAALAELIGRWDEVPAGAVPAPDVPIEVTEESLALGEALFASNCSVCHGPEGQGTPRAPALNEKGFLEDTGDQAVQQIITLGVSGTAMQAWGDRLVESDIQAIVGFVRTWEADAPEVATPTRPGRGGGGPPWMQETVTGEEILASGDVTATTEPRDWRQTILVAGVLAVAFTFVALGYGSFRRHSLGDTPHADSDPDPD